MNNYRDKNNCTTIQDGVRTENPLYLTALEMKLKKLNGTFKKEDAFRCWEIVLNCHYYKNGNLYIDNYPPERNPEISIDEVTGFYWLVELGQCWSVKEKLPVLVFNDKVWFHPNGWMILLGYRSKFYKFIFNPFVRFMNWYSEFTSKPGETTDDLLWFLRVEEGETDRYAAFVIYITNNGNFNNMDNPILEQARILWNRKQDKNIQI